MLVIVIYFYCVLRPPSFFSDTVYCTAVRKKYSAILNAGIVRGGSDVGERVSNRGSPATVTTSRTVRILPALLPR